jgi:hypothetical protein
MMNKYELARERNRMKDKFVLSAEQAAQVIEIAVKRNLPDVVQMAKKLMTVKISSLSDKDFYKALLIVDKLWEMQEDELNKRDLASPYDYGVADTRNYGGYGGTY